LTPDQGERVALVFEDEEYSYNRLDALAAGLAATLAARGVGAGDRVALMSANRPEWIVAVRAIWRLGASVVLFSPAWKLAETEHALAITQPAHAVGDHPVLAGLMPMLNLDEPIEPIVSIEPLAPTEETADQDPAAEAVLVFSSGTTGLPKAVIHTHGSLRAAISHWRDALELTSADRIQVTTPPSHILGLLNIATALELGIWMRLHRRFDLDRMLSAIEADKITVEMAVAPIALALANHPKLESYDLSSLRFIMWGATPVTPSVAQTVSRRTGVAWVPAYGASELPVIACNPVRGARLDSAGKPVPGVELRVVSLETGQPVTAAGETGEIQLRAPSLMSGYLPAEETAASFDHGWYRTGDVGYVEPDGWVHLTDRSKEMIKVRGFQVAPAEVEGVLLGHPGVRDCAVFGVPDPVNGESIIAAVALDPSGAATIPHELIEFVGDRLASYKKPANVIIVDQIPRLPSGKALRRVLKENYLRETDGRAPVG
jgi:acyl-CoA synthetase (AMP-forming)/AMP-acid ligase II